MKSKNQKKRRSYPEKHREERAKLIRKTQPWTKSTGPKTPDGKAASATNALKSGLHTTEIKTLRKLLNTQAAQINTIKARHDL